MNYQIWPHQDDSQYFPSGSDWKMTQGFNNGVKILMNLITFDTPHKGIVKNNKQEQNSPKSYIRDTRLA